MTLRRQVGINPARIVCTSSINTRLLANACAWEGASTLVNNLLVRAVARTGRESCRRTRPNRSCWTPLHRSPCAKDEEERTCDCNRVTGPIRAGLGDSFRRIPWVLVLRTSFACYGDIRGDSARVCDLGYRFNTSGKGVF